MKKYSKYNVITIPGAELSHRFTNYPVKVSVDILEVIRVESLVQPIPFSLRLNDISNDPIYVPNAKEIVDDSQIKTIFLSTDTTVATSTPILLLLQGISKKER